METPDYTVKEMVKIFSRMSDIDLSKWDLEDVAILAGSTKAYAGICENLLEKYEPTKKQTFFIKSMDFFNGEQ